MFVIISNDLLIKLNRRICNIVFFLFLIKLDKGRARQIKMVLHAEHKG